MGFLSFYLCSEDLLISLCPDISMGNLFSKSDPVSGLKSESAGFSNNSTGNQLKTPGLCKSLTIVPLQVLKMFYKILLFSIASGSAYYREL